MDAPPHQALHRSARDIRELLEAGFTEKAEEIYRGVAEPSLNAIAHLLAENRELIRGQIARTEAEIEQKSANLLRQNVIFWRWPLS